METQLLVHSDSLIPVLWPSSYRVQTFTGGWGAFCSTMFFRDGLIYLLEREERKESKDRCAVPGSRSLPEAWTTPPLMALSAQMSRTAHGIFTRGGCQYNFGQQIFNVRWPRSIRAGVRANAGPNNRPTAFQSVQTP